ncbi:hypothetical protein D3C84_1000440 [compost metagenome]
MLPIGTPNACETAKPADAIPNAFGILGPENSAGMEAQTCGDVKAALTPAKKRNQNMDQKPVAKPHRIVETEKQTMPKSITFLRSHPSESGPATKANTA